MRAFITYIVPLIAPALIYFSWVVLSNRKKAANEAGADRRRLADGPWFRLAFAGLALTVLVLMGMAYFGGNAPGGQYQAPRLENGKVVPGYVKRPAP